MLKKLVAPVVIGGALLGGVAAGGTAYAAAPTTSATTTPHHAGKGPLRSWVRAHRKELRKAGLTISAKAIGITPQALAADLKAGNSIAGVASQHDVNPQTVVTALVSAADARVDQAVNAGRLTSTQGSNIGSRLPTVVTKIVDHTF